MHINQKMPNLTNQYKKEGLKINPTSSKFSLNVTYCFLIYMETRCNIRFILFNKCTQTKSHINSQNSAEELKPCH